MKTLAKSLLLGLIFSISFTNATLANSGTKPGDKPVFRHEGNVVYLNLFNEDSSKVIIEVYDANMRLVFGEVDRGHLVVGKVLSFKKAFKGDYTILVADGGNTYTTKLSIQ